MEEKGEKNEKAAPSAPLKIDSKCFRDALRSFFPPIRNEDPRLDFYTIYKREVTQYDAEYVKKYDDDLNTTLIFSGLFSAVSSAFVIAVQPSLQPNSNDQSAALLRAILLTLNQSTIPNEAATIPPIQQGPSSSGIVTVTVLMYASLLISLLAAFTAMLGKQWLNRYLRNAGGSMIERCGDRQRKCDGLNKWPFHLFIEGLPIMLQIALLLLISGLCKYMAPINTPVAAVLIAFTVISVLFYLGIIIAGTSSYECPFQTPASTALRRWWEKIGPHIAAAFRPIVSAGTFLYKRLAQLLALTTPLWENILFLWKILYALFWLPLMERCDHLLPVRHPAPREPSRSPLRNLRKSIRSAILRIRLPQPAPLQIIPDTALAILRKTNANDVRCISWILWNITDPEALDAAVRLAGTVRWFDDGTDAKPPRDLLITTFRACFDSSGTLYPGFRDRAYRSAQAILWVHICAMCESEEFSREFPLPNVQDHKSFDPDLKELLELYHHLDDPYIFWTRIGDSQVTPTHLQWTSVVFLHLYLAIQKVPTPRVIHSGPDPLERMAKERNIPLNTRLNRLLASCISLGQPADEELLATQDKSDRLEQVLSQVSKAVISAVRSPNPHCKFLLLTLHDLCKLDRHPIYLTTMAYEWCSVLCENYSKLEDGNILILLCLEIGFRHLDPQDGKIEAKLTHTQHHQKLWQIVYETQESWEAISDLLLSWTSKSDSHDPYPLRICAKGLIGFPAPASGSRLRQLVIRAIEHIPYKEFEEVGPWGFLKLLNDLHVCVEDIQSVLPIDNRMPQWAKILLDTIQSSHKNRRDLLHPNWELLVELLLSDRLLLARNYIHDPNIMISLRKDEAWEKLECWIGIVWIVWIPQDGRVTEEYKDLEDVMLSLFHQQPSAIQKLEQWMRKSIKWRTQVPESFQQICKQATSAGT